MRLYTLEVNVICLGWNTSTSSCCLNQTISTSCMWSLHFSRGCKKKSNKIILFPYVKPNPPLYLVLKKAVLCMLLPAEEKRTSPVFLFRLVIFTPRTRENSSFWSFLLSLLQNATLLPSPRKKCCHPQLRFSKKYFPSSTMHLFVQLLYLQECTSHHSC